jgi:hypothetical protein
MQRLYTHLRTVPALLVMVSDSATWFVTKQASPVRANSSNQPGVIPFPPLFPVFTVRSCSPRRVDDGSTNSGNPGKKVGGDRFGAKDGVLEKIRAPNGGFLAPPTRRYPKCQLLTEPVPQVASSAAAALDRAPGKPFGLTNVVDRAGNEQPGWRERDQANRTKAGNKGPRWPEGVSSISDLPPHTFDLHLKQRRRSSLPAFAFGLCDAFQIVHVSAGLGQDMMQIVADADEGESLFQEFPDPGGAEQKESQDEFVFTGAVDQFLRGCGEFGRSVHVRKLVFFEQPHRHAQIVLAEE